MSSSGVSPRPMTMHVSTTQAISFQPLRLVVIHSSSPQYAAFHGIHRVNSHKSVRCERAIPERISHQQASGQWSRIVSSIVRYYLRCTWRKSNKGKSMMTRCDRERRGGMRCQNFCVKFQLRWINSMKHSKFKNRGLTGRRLYNASPQSIQTKEIEERSVPR